MAASIASTFSRFARAAALLAVAGISAAGAAAQSRSMPQKARDGEERGRPTIQRPAVPKPVRGPGAEIFFCETRDVQCRTGLNTFRVDDVRDLFVFAAWRGVSGERTQRLRFILPDGNTYQTIETKFTTESSSADPQVQVAVPSREEKAVHTHLAVAGTHITQRSLTGTWTVELYLDGRFIARSSLVLEPRTP